MADFTNIDGVYAKDTELRSGIDTLRTTVLSNTIKPLTVTKNGTYTAIPSSGTYGYSPITVDVQEEPWTPLQDGYSNFWFELTNDTLSPWLNFSAKTENAVIDWGDGSGEQILNTLHPTHTYSKAGKYVVKCKGVIGIEQQIGNNTQNDYFYCDVLKNVELNNTVTSLSTFSFRYCCGLKNIVFDELTTISNSCFSNSSVLENISGTLNVASLNPYFIYTNYMLKTFSLGTHIQTIGNYNVYGANSLTSITIPQQITSIGTTCFAQCLSLSEIHCQATTPPTLGTGCFVGLPSDFIIYVPTGYGDTYKSAAGWSTYADHILEEGQTPNRAMLAKFNSAKTEEVKDDELYQDENR